MPKVKHMVSSRAGIEPGWGAFIHHAILSALCCIFLSERVNELCKGYLTGKWRVFDGNHHSSLETAKDIPSNGRSSSMVCFGGMAVLLWWVSAAEMRQRSQGWVLRCSQLTLQMYILAHLHRSLSILTQIFCRIRHYSEIISFPLGYRIFILKESIA